MRITVDKIYHNERNESGIVAFCDIVLEYAFLVRGLMIVEKEFKNEIVLDVQFPNRKTRNGYIVGIAYPIQSDLRKAIKEIILQEYRIDLTK